MEIVEAFVAQLQAEKETLDTVLPSMIFQLAPKKHVLKEEARCLSSVLRKRVKSVTMQQMNFIKSKTKIQVIDLSHSKNLQVCQMVLHNLLLSFL